MGDGDSQNDNHGLVTDLAGLVSNITDSGVGVTAESSEVLDTYTEEVVSAWLWRTVPPVLFLVGLIGNGLTVVVIYRLGVKRQPTMVFLVFLAISDCVVLVIGLPRYWIVYVFDFDLKTTSNVYCKVYYFLIYLSMQYSSWVLVGVSLERVAKTYAPFAYKRLYSDTKVTVGLFSTLFILCLVNGHFFFTNGINDYTQGECGSLNDDFFYFDEHVFTWIDFILLSLIPFIIMLICGVLLFRILKIAKQNRQSMMHKSVLHRANRFSVRMTKMLVVCTVYFVLATAPISVYFITSTDLVPRYEEAENNKAIATMDLIWTISYLIQFSNYCANFYLYTATNKRFYREMKSVLCCCARHLRVNIYRVHSEDNRGRASNSSIGLEMPETESAAVTPKLATIAES